MEPELIYKIPLKSSIKEINTLLKQLPKFTRRYQVKHRLSSFLKYFKTNDVHI